MGQPDRLADRQRNGVKHKGRERQIASRLRSIDKFARSRSAPALCTEARSPSGKAKVCKTFIGGSIPPRASHPKSMSLKRLTLLASVHWAFRFCCRIVARLVAGHLRSDH